MMEVLLNAIASLGAAEAQNVLTAAGASAVKNYKDSCTWKKVIVGAGEFFIKNEQEENLFFDDLALVLSKENLSQIAKDLKLEDGYDLKYSLYKTLMQLMSKYEIPYEIAESYTIKIIYAVLEQLRTVSPEKYEHYFFQEWKDEQERNFIELQNRIDKMSKEIVSYDHEQLEIESSGNMDIHLRRSTCCPSIGIDFFCIDDERFQDGFKDLRYDEIVFIKGRNREETIYCILNELWRLNDKRPIYVVKNLESWKKLQTMENKGNVYIPWFYADEIVAIENNTNIFVIDEGTPTFGKRFLKLRPRTRDTLSKCLQDAGLEYSKVYSLLEDTHGLYSQMKKQMFRGEYLKVPSWMSGISERVKKICLLIGSWEEIEGDKLVIESLYGDSYDNFLEEINPYVNVEDPFLYAVKRNGSISYYLASAENSWSYLNVLTYEKVWKSYEEMFLLVINESENLFTYDNQEKLLAQFSGEKLFWSETIRKGMLRTMLIKGAYQNDVDTQNSLNWLVEKVLNCVKSEKQWMYIAKFWRELCEISPKAVLEKMEQETIENTGLFSLFQNQSEGSIFDRNSSEDILWGIEQYLVQKDFFWRAFRWILQLDSQEFQYKSNSLKHIFTKIFCIWINITPLRTAVEKINAAELAFQIDNQNVWDYLYAAINHRERIIVGELLSPRYREYSKIGSTTISEVRKTESGYLKLLMNHMDFSVERWKKILDLSSELSKELRKDIFHQLSYELEQLTDEEIMIIKNEIRCLIYRHRYFAFSEWSMSEENILEYEAFLNKIKLNTPEYEYAYLFTNRYECPLLNPIPYSKERKRDENEKAKEKLIREKLTEFQELGYDLKILASVCTKESYSSLGIYLAKYWGKGKWNDSTFNCLLLAQKSGEIALDYLRGFNNKECLFYNEIIQDLMNKKYPIGIIADVYRIEAFRTKDIPLVSNATEQIKKEFWRSSIYCEEQNELWALGECKKYATLNVYLDQIYRIHYSTPLQAEKIFECFDGIEKMPHANSDQMTEYHVKQLMMVMQEAYIDDIEKCRRLSHLEILFANFLKWENMKCFHKMIKQSPELSAQLVEGIFKKDHDVNTGQKKNQTYIGNMYTIYDKAHFCPTEANGKVDEYELEQWIEKYKQLLIENDQESLFTNTLGRLLSFSPVGLDGHEPCEAVRKMIEKYGDDEMLNEYQIAVYNRRGVFNLSAGKTELKMAEKFKENALYLEPHYPKTAKIFFDLYETYKIESDRERMYAESGWY